jgi:tetratricopeptide (TPR) repeat protein
VAASLVTFAPATGRYAMLETVHAFARRRLIESGEGGVAGDRHLAWCRQFAAESAPGLAGSEAAPHVHRLDSEQANMRAALRSAIADGRHLEDAGRLAHDLLVYWSLTGASGEAVGWIRQILERPAPLTATRAALSLALSDHLSYMGDIAASGRACDDALEMARSLGDRGLVARCLIDAAFFSKVDEKAGLAVEAQTIADDLGDADLWAAAAHMQGLLAARAGRCADAVACYQQALASSRDPSHMLGTRYMLAIVLVSQGCWEAAREQLVAEEREKAEVASRLDAAGACVLLAQVELARDDLVGAERAYERATVWGRPADDYLAEQMVFDAAGALVRAARGDLRPATETARRIAAVPVDATGHGLVCLAWLQAGEVLARAGDSSGARKCFANILRHRTGRFPRDRALGLAGVAGTLTDQSAIGSQLATAAGAMSKRHGFIPPPWLTAARYDNTVIPDGPEFTDDEAVAVAISLDDT